LIDVAGIEKIITTLEYEMSLNPKLSNPNLPDPTCRTDKLTKSQFAELGFGRLVEINEGKTCPTGLERSKVRLGSIWRVGVQQVCLFDELGLGKLGLAS